MDKDPLLIHRLFLDMACKYPQDIALQLKKGALWERRTYREVEESSRKIASFLAREGFKKSDFAVLVSENRPEWAVAYLGIVRAGLACVPLDPQLSAQEIKHLVADSGAKVIFCARDIFVNKIRQDMAACVTKYIMLDTSQGDDQADCIELNALLNVEAPSEGFLPSVSPDDTASLIYTSGTTGQPKGVPLSHKNICSNFLSIKKLDICFHADNFLSILPLHHTYPFMVTLIVPLCYGARITYCLTGFKPKELISIINEAGVTVLAGVPLFFSLLHRSIFEQLRKIPRFLLPLVLVCIGPGIRLRLGRSLRLMVTGGARLEPEIASDFAKLGFTLVEGYGLTETSPIVTLNPPKRIKFGSAGKPVPEVQIKIVSADAAGVGQVAIRGPNVFSGYFRQPGLTAEALKDGWFYSGDLGYIDRQGYLFLTGRQKDVIVLSSGKNIYPEELEDHYNKSPYIKEICILSRKEEKFGHALESLFAVIVPDLDYFRQKGEGDMRGKIRWELENLGRELPAYQHIMGFSLIKEELPRTALKKIKRFEVTEKYLQKQGDKASVKEPLLRDEDRELLLLPVAQKIISYLATELKKPVYPDSNLELDLGIDSLTRVELGLGLEALLSIKVPEEALYGVSTVKEVIVKINEFVEKTGAKEATAKGRAKSWSGVLSALPPARALKRIRIEERFLDTLLTFIFRNIILCIFRVFWGLRVEGRGRVPRRGPFLICPNHASYLDGFAVFAGLPLRNAPHVFFLGFSRIFEHPLVRWAITTARLIPVDPHADFTETMQCIAYLVKHKKSVCIFPEGRRSIDEQVGEFKRGVGILIKELGVPAVPVYIKNSHRSWPRGKRLPRFVALKITFGTPLEPQDLLSAQVKRDSADEYETIARGLRDAVLGLKG